MKTGPEGEKTSGSERKKHEYNRDKRKSKYSCLLCKGSGGRSEIQTALKELYDKKYTEHPSSMPEDLCYLSGKYLEDYLHDIEICQKFAKRNREKMAEIILDRTGLSGGESFHTIHNYIDTDEMILRKGSIAAHKDVYTTSVNESTIDEAPMAYKSLTDIIDVITESVDVIEVMKPIYNFKAST